MAWPVPSPAEIAARQAAAQVAAFQGAGLGDVDATSPAAPLGILNRTIAGSIFGVHVEQARLAQELMPDTAFDWLDRHGAVWGVARRQAVAAGGNLMVSGATGTVVPIGASFTTASGALYTVAIGVTIGTGGGSWAVRVVAAQPGAAGNLAAPTVLGLTSPIAGLNPQSGAVDGSGITGGADLESADSWRARILARIRAPAAGGAAADYVQWTTAVAPGAIVKAVGGWTGAGSVGVLVALAGPSALDGTTQAAIAAHIAALRPVTAQVNVVAATLAPVAFTLHLNPDTSANRAAALAALALQIEADAAIGGTLYMSRIDAALSNASGEFSHERTAPAADVVLAASAVATLGTVTWV